MFSQEDKSLKRQFDPAAAVEYMRPQKRLSFSRDTMCPIVPPWADRDPITRSPRPDLPSWPQITAAYYPWEFEDWESEKPNLEENGLEESPVTAQASSAQRPRARPIPGSE